jgi:hypothetical protein
MASGGLSQTIGVFSNGGALRASDMTVVVTGTSAVGVFIFRGASITLLNTSVTASGEGWILGLKINFSSPTIRNSVISSSGAGIEVNDANDTPPWDVVTIDTTQIHSEGPTLVNNFDWPGMTAVRIGASQLAGGDIVTVTANISFKCAGVYDENLDYSPGCP